MSRNPPILSVDGVPHGYDASIINRDVVYSTNYYKPKKFNLMSSDLAYLDEGNL